MIVLIGGRNMKINRIYYVIKKILFYAWAYHSLWALMKPFLDNQELRDINHWKISLKCNAYMRYDKDRTRDRIHLGWATCHKATYEKSVMSLDSYDWILIPLHGRIMSNICRRNKIMFYWVFSGMEVKLNEVFYCLYIDR